MIRTPPRTLLLAWFVLGLPLAPGESVAQAPAVHALDGGAALFEQRRYAEAKMRLQRLAADNPEDPQLAYYLGRIALVEGNPKAAAHWLERATRAAPTTGEYHRWLGRAYAREALRASKLRGAVLAGRIRDAFETAVALDPEDVDARFDLLQFYIVAPAIAGGNVRKARMHAGEIAQRNPYRGRLAAGMIAERRGSPEDARREYVGALTAFPDSAAAYYALGGLEQRNGDAVAALRTYETLLERRPDERAVYYHIGRTGSLSGVALERAAEALRIYLAEPPREGDPSLASAHYRLALVLQQLGDTARAKQEYTVTLRLDPTQREAREALKRLP